MRVSYFKHVVESPIPHNFKSNKTNSHRFACVSSSRNFYDCWNTRTPIDQKKLRLLNPIRLIPISNHFRAFDLPSTCSLSLLTPIHHLTHPPPTRPQLATHKNPFGVTIGATLGHVICTSIAVVGGRMLAAKISQRTVASIGGLLFLAFAVHSYFTPPI